MNIIGNETKEKKITDNYKDDLRVVVTWMVEIVTNGCGEENAQVFTSHLLPQLTQVNHPVHHLRHAETVPKVVKGIISVVLLDAKLK